MSFSKRLGFYEEQSELIFSDKSRRFVNKKKEIETIAQISYHNEFFSDLQTTVA